MKYGHVLSRLYLIKRSVESARRLRSTAFDALLGLKALGYHIASGEFDVFVAPLSPSAGSRHLVHAAAIPSAYAAERPSFCHRRSRNDDLQFTSERNDSSWGADSNILVDQLAIKRLEVHMSLTGNFAKSGSLRREGLTSRDHWTSAFAIITIC